MNVQNWLKTMSCSTGNFTKHVEYHCDKSKAQSVVTDIIIGRRLSLCYAQLLKNCSIISTASKMS